MELEQEHSKDWILNQYLNTASYGTNDGRTAVGVEAALADLLQQARQRSRPRRSGAARRPAAGARPSTTRSSTRRRRKTRRNEVLDAMDKQGYIARAERRSRRPTASASTPAPNTRRSSEPYFFDYVEQRADRAVRRQHGPRGRAEGLHDDQPAPPGATPSRRSTTARPGSRPVGRARRQSTPPPATSLAMASSGTYDRAQFNLAAKGHRQPGSSFKPFVLDDGAQAGHRPGHHLLQRHQPGDPYPSISTASRGWSTTPSPAAAR